MKMKHGFATAIVALCAFAQLVAQNSSHGGAVNSTNSTQHARGTFDVKITPQKADNPVSEAANFARMTIDKQFHGDLEGTSKGEMIATSGEAKGSGAYVALERVTASVGGRSGSFVFHHTGLMHDGRQQLKIEVVPGSGIGQLQGIAGKLNLTITDGKHFYDFEYTLPAGR